MNFNIYLLYRLKKIINVLIAQFMRHSESIPSVEIQCLQVIWLMLIYCSYLWSSRENLWEAMSAKMAINPRSVFGAN